MAQFDVFRNQGRNRGEIPFVVVVQSGLYDAYRRRVVVPLVKASSLGSIANTHFNPAFEIEGITVVLHPLEIVSVPRDQLTDFVCSLADEGSRVLDALDDLLTQAWH